MNLAAEYLYLKMWDIWDPFQMCITTYALHLAGHKARSEAFGRMRSMQREGTDIRIANLIVILQVLL